MFFSYVKCNIWRRYLEGGHRVARAAYSVGGADLFNELLPTMTGQGGEGGRRKLCTRWTLAALKGDCRVANSSLRNHYEIIRFFFLGGKLTSNRPFDLCVWAATHRKVVGRRGRPDVAQAEIRKQLQNEDEGGKDTCGHRAALHLFRDGDGERHHVVHRGSFRGRVFRRRSPHG